jgi:hypothetical protein
VIISTQTVHIAAVLHQHEKHTAALSQHFSMSSIPAYVNAGAHQFSGCNGTSEYGKGTTKHTKDIGCP